MHLDIDDQGDGRLSFGFGSHMMNDREWGQEDDSGVQNNTIFDEDLSVIVKRDIQAGEELTVSYNLSE